MAVQFAHSNNSYTAVLLSASIYIEFVVTWRMCVRACGDINRLRKERSFLFNDIVNAQDYLASVVDE